MVYFKAWPVQDAGKCALWVRPMSDGVHNGSQQWGDGVFILALIFVQNHAGVDCIPIAARSCMAIAAPLVLPPP